MKRVNLELAMSLANSYEYQRALPPGAQAKVPEQPAPTMAGQPVFIPPGVIPLINIPLDHKAHTSNLLPPERTCTHFCELVGIYTGMIIYSMLHVYAEDAKFSSGL